jgi:hypothetical protein
MLVIIARRHVLHVVAVEDPAAGVVHQHLDHGRAAGLTDRADQDGVLHRRAQRAACSVHEPEEVAMHVHGVVLRIPPPPMTSPKMRVCTLVGLAGWRGSLRTDPQVG